MRQTLLFLLFLIILKPSFSQDNFKIRYDYDAVGNANFIADNYSSIPVYVALDFSYLENASFSEELPYIKRINPGTTPLFTIYKEMDMPSPDFSIELNWYMSHPSPEIDPEFPYLIPSKPGTEVLITSEIEKENNRAIGFELTGSNEVVASRKGVVVRVIRNNHSNLPTAKGNQFNMVQLLHEDGTVGEYYNFAYNKISCQPGQTIFPGQIIGKANPLENGNYLIGFSLFHSILNSKRREFLIPEFFIGEKGISQVETGKSYISVYDEKIVKEELTRKERKLLKDKK